MGYILKKGQLKGKFLTPEEVSAENEDLVREACDGCPVEAISIEE